MRIGAVDATYIVTLLRLLPEQSAVELLVNRISITRPFEIQGRIIEVQSRIPVAIGEATSVVLLGLRGDKARFQIDAPRESSVHRLEVYEKMQRGKPTPAAG